ncbi:MAG: hypothetical protein ACRDQ5_17100 [Sciscionella sp.]
MSTAAEQPPPDPTLDDLAGTPDAVMAGEPGEPPLRRQVAVALETLENVLDTVEEIVPRLTRLEHRAPTAAGTGGEGAEDPLLRGDFRVERYVPEEATDTAVHAAIQRATTAWRRLDAWVGWAVATYRLHPVIPPCWAEHPLIVQELIGLALAWQLAWNDEAPDDALTVFHERLHRTKERLADGNWGSPRCKGEHDPGGITDAASYREWARDPNHDTAVCAALNRATAELHGTPPAWRHTRTSHTSDASHAEDTRSAAGASSPTSGAPR